jgi:Flp pilus assembly secretin CpaC
VAASSTGWEARTVMSDCELTEVVNVFRTMFDIRFIVPAPSQSLITVRASQPVLDAATDWVERLDSSRPQVLLDINAYEVNKSVMRTFGVNLPLQFQIFSIPASALDILKLPNIQDAIQKIIANGGLTPANLQAIQALLAQFQSLQGSPFLSQNFFAFGGGATLFGVLVPPATVVASLNDSRVSHLQHVTLRAAQGSTTIFHIGDRYPVITSSFAAASANPQLSAVLPQATGTPLPTFSYEDLGISLKATPQVFTHDLPASDLPAGDREDAVGLQFEMNVRALTGQSFNGVPLISNREYKGAIQLRDGEPAVITSMVSANESSSLSGLPGFAYTPLLSTLVSTRNKQKSDTQIMLVITPHILRARQTGSPNEQWIPRAH